MWCTSARLFRRVTLVEPLMDTAATDGSAKRSRVDRLKQRRLRRDSDALTQAARSARLEFLAYISACFCLLALLGAYGVVLTTLLTVS